MDTKICHKCGHAVPHDAITCKNCGSFFFAPQSEMTDMTAVGEQLKFNNRSTGYGPQDEGSVFYGRQAFNIDTEHYSGDLNDSEDRSDEYEYGGYAYEQNDEVNYYDDAYYDDYEDTDEEDYDESADERYKKIVIIVLSALFVLIIVVILLLFLTRDDLSGFGKKDGASSISYFSSANLSSQDSSSVLDTITILDSSEADENEDDSSSETDEDSSKEDESSEEDSSEDDESFVDDPSLPDPYIPPQTQTQPPVTDPPVTEPPQTDPPVTDPPVTEPPLDSSEPDISEPDSQTDSSEAEQA